MSIPKNVLQTQVRVSANPAKASLKTAGDKIKSNIFRTGSLSAVVLLTLLFQLVGSVVNAQTVLVNYDFGSSSAGCSATPATLASGITSSFSTSLSCIGNRSGTSVSTPTSFATNSSGGNSIAMTGGFSNSYFQFNIAGAQLSTYSGFKVFLSYNGDNSVGTINFQYSTDGSTFTTLQSIANSTNWTNITLNLSGVAALNSGVSNLYFRVLIGSSGNGKFFDIDNFQLYSGCTAGSTQLNALPGTVALCQGSTFSNTLTFAASAPSYTYQWYRNGTAITGATNATYSIASVTTTNSGNYNVTATNTCGTYSSNTIALTVSTPTTVSITGASTICAGLTTTLSPTTGGTWTSNNPSVATVTNAGVVTGVAAGSATFTFTQSSGACSSTTSAVTVSAAPTTPAVTNNSRCGTGTVALSASSGGFVIDWYAASTGGTALVTANNNYTTPSISATTTYYVVARNTGTGCVSFPRTPVTATVNAVPADLTPVAASSIFCPGSSVNINIASSEVGVNYQLRNNATNATVGAAVAGTGGTISLPTGSLTANTTFNILATNATTSCNRQLSTLVTITSDNVVPTITCPGNQTINLDASCSAVMPDYTSLATASDNCTPSGSIVLTQVPAAGSTLASAGNVTVTITATDASGNSSNCTFTLTKLDVTPPVITCPADITVNAVQGQCGAFVNYTISSTDNCANFCAPSSIPGFTLIGTLNGHTYFRSTAAVNWATANANAIALGGHLVTITSAAENTFLSTVGLSWTGMSDAAVEGTWTWVTGEPVTYTNWNAGEPNNSNGNENYMHINYNVAGGWNDISGANSYNYIVEFDCVTTTLTSGYSSGSLFPIGTTTVTHTATDYAGNTSSCSFNVTVNDVTAPIITCPANISVTAAAGQCTATVNYSAPSVIDNCGSCSAAAPISGFTTLGLYNGYAYYISTSSIAISSAFAAAQAAGGQVATINSAAENTFVRNAATSAGYTGNYYIGINDAAVEGTFVGGSGEPIVYTNWNAGEPNDYGGNEDYTQVYANGLWNDMSGTSTGNYILKVSCLSPTRTSGLASGSSFPLGTSTVSYSATDGAGNTSNCSFTVTVNLSASSTNKTITAAAATICSGSSTNINIAASDNGVSYQLRNNATNANIGSPVVGTGGTISLSTGALTSTTTFNIYATTTDGCSFQLTNTATVTVNALPAVTAPASVCVGSTATLSPTTGGTWSSSNTAVATVTNAGVISGVAAGTATFTFTQTSTGCSATTSSVTVNSLPTVSITGASAICAGLTTTLSPTTGGTWSSSNTAVATVTNAGVVSGVAAGTASFTFTSTATGCSRTSSSVTVNALPTVLAITGANAVCVGVTTNLADATPGGVWSSSNTSIASVNASGVVTGVASGTAIVSYAVTNGSGCTTIVTKSITVNANPAVAAITGASAVCAGSTTTFSNTTTGGTWSSSNTAVATVNVSGVVTGMAAGTATISYAVTNGSGCTTTVTKSITVNATPLMTSAASKTICSGSNVALGLTSNIAATYTWVAAANANVTGESTTAQTGGTITDNLVNTTTTAQTVTYTVTPTASGCSGVAQTVTITVNPAASVANQTATICNASTFTVSPTGVPAGTTYSWAAPVMSSGVSGGYAATGQASVSQALWVSGLVDGTAVYTVTPQSGTCSGASFTVTVTINAQPYPSYGSATICSGSSFSVVAPNLPAASTFSWSAPTGTGFSGGAAGTNQASVNGTLVNTGTATATATYTVTPKNGLCTGGTFPVVITVNPASSLPTAGSNSRCGTGAVTITATPGSGETIDWYAASTGGTALLSGNTSYTTPSISSTTVYYAEARNTTTGCVSATRTAVTATVNALPSVPAAGNSSRCGTGTVTITATPGSGQTIDWYAASTGGTALLSGNTSYTTPSISSTTVYYAGARNTTTGCISATRTAVTATVNALPSVPAAGSNSRCGTGAVTITATPGSGQTIDWYAASTGGTALLSGNTSYTTPSISSTTVYYAGARNTTTGCISATRTAVTATINALPLDKSVNAVATTICSGTSAIIQVAASQSGVNYQLRDASNTNIGSPAAGNGGTISLPSGALTDNTTFNVLATSTSTACGVQMSTTVTVSVNASGQWIGGTSGDWNVPGNWCGGVPTSSTNVAIPSGTTVNIQTTNAVANSVTISAGGSLVMTGSNNLSISAGGTFTNNGTFNATTSTGTVSFLGNGTISGTTTFKNIDTYGALNFGTASTINGIFTIQTGGSVTGNSPTYNCPAATLAYNTGGIYLRGLEWTSSSSGAGVPANVIIQNNTVINFPVVGQGYVCNDLQIENGSSLRQDYSGGSAVLRVGRNITINGVLSLGGSNGGDLYVGGSWTRTSTGVFTHNDRKVVFDGPANFSGNGTSMATISAPASSVKDNEGGFGGENFAHLWINKTNATDSVVLLSNITVNREIGLTKGTFSLRNSDVTLVSNDTRTADVAPITNPANASIRYGGTGRFAVQRFIHNPTGTRSWRLVTAPLEPASAPSINQAYQEAVVNPDRSNPNGSGGIYNPWPGYGTHITGPGGTYSLTNGFDQGTNSSSMLYAGPGVLTWPSVASTKSVKVTDQPGWMLFVRGDRSFVIGGPYQPSQNTTLEPKGKINTGDVVKPIVAGKQVVGNPYPSAISLLNVDVAGTSGGNAKYYMWDPKMYTSYTSPGKWVTFLGIGSYFVQTTSASAYASDGTIESGMAFVLDAPAAGNITFHESDKLPLTSSLIGNTSGVLARPVQAPAIPMFRTDVYAANSGKYTLTDGVLNVFDDSFDNDTKDDAEKFINFNSKESFSIAKAGQKIAIEKRKQVAESDTIFYAMANMNELPYRLRFEASNFNPGLEAYLVDKYLNTQTPVSTDGVTTYNFNITADALSKAQDRFKVVFKTAFNVLPVTFTSVKAWPNGKDIAVQWNVSNELNVKQYHIQKSTDGAHFESIGTVAAQGNGQQEKTYQFTDVNAVAGANYFRIQSEDKDGKTQYSSIVKVNMNNIKGAIQLYNNPVTDNAIKVSLTNMQKGNYSVRLLNSAGQLIKADKITHLGGSAVHTIKPDQILAQGIYHLEISNPVSGTVTVKVSVQ